MTAADFVQYSTSIGTLIAAIVSAILSLRNGFKSDVIAKHVNSTATAQQVKIDTLLETIATLTEDKAKQEQIAALLAQSQAKKENPVT